MHSVHRFDPEETKTHPYRRRASRVLQSSLTGCCPDAELLLALIVSVTKPTPGAGRGAHCSFNPTHVLVASSFQLEAPRRAQCSMGRMKRGILILTA
jgi:hypothetical protein